MMMKQNLLKRNIALATIVATMLLMVSGCGKKADQATEGDSMAAGEVTYPICSTETITYWEYLDASVLAVSPTKNDTPFAKGLIERTGINVKYIHPPLGQEREKFNLMLSSGDMPDIISYPLSETSEGAEKLIESGYVYPMSDDFLSKYLPNYKKLLDADTELQKLSRTDNGKYYAIANVRDSSDMTSVLGLMLRKDWLDELKLPVPETIDEWHTVLTAFKEQKKASAPLTFLGLDFPFQYGAIFVGAYGEKKDFYSENGDVKFGPIGNGYKEFLTTMRDWYSEGLIDKNFPVQTDDELAAKMLNGYSGSTFGYIGSSMGKFLAAKPSDSYDIIAAPYPTVSKGGIAKFSGAGKRLSTPQYFISGSSKKKELAARLLDYGYSDEGKMYYNFGTEGISYNMVNGFPEYSDLILHNSEQSAATMLGQYTCASYSGPYIMDKRFFRQQYPYEQQKAAIDIWAKTDNDKYTLWGDTLATADENAELSKIMNDVKSYVDEMTTKYIMGIESLDSFDSYVAQIRSIGIDKAIKIKKDCYDRYMAK